MKRHHSALRGLRVWVWLVVSVSILLGTGCGGKKSTISGTVSYRGKPLPLAIIKFINAANKEIVGGATISDGGYSVSGIPPGPVQIIIHMPPPTAPIKDKAMDGAASRRVTVPAKYSNTETSGLTYTVQPGSQQAPPIDLQ